MLSVNNDLSGGRDHVRGHQGNRRGPVMNWPREICAIGLDCGAILRHSFRKDLNSSLAANKSELTDEGGTSQQHSKDVKVRGRSRCLSRRTQLNESASRTVLTWSATCGAAACEIDPGNFWGAARSTPARQSLRISEWLCANRRATFDREIRHNGCPLCTRVICAKHHANTA